MSLKNTSMSYRHRYFLLYKICVSTVRRLNLDKINKDYVIRTLKMFLISFIFFALIYIIISKLLRYDEKFTLDYDYILFPFALAAGSTIGYYKNSKKCSKKIIFEGITNENPVIKLKKVMKSIHWSIQNENHEKIVFKSSLLRTFITEHIIVNINENSLELLGPKQYVEKIVKKLQTQINA